ncbi:hypothetical protein [Streptomyces sp. NPDC053427]|uniref:hypothetical protein n=1 Tax=Streptomyces sp. NPDC053427 TaxID=3365701 RepID=UPI0037D06E64
MNRTPSTTRRRKTAAGAAALAGAAVLGTFATAQAAAAVPAHSAATPYVMNHYGEEHADKGHAERSPQHLVLSEFTSAHGVHWKQWSARRAVGTGTVTGTWCLDTCADKPLKATVTLSAPRTVHGKRVFSAFTLKLAGQPGRYVSQDLHGRRPLATG